MVINIQNKAVVGLLVLPLNVSQEYPWDISKTEYLTSTNTLGCLNLVSVETVSWPFEFSRLFFFSIGVTEGHQDEGKVNCPRHVPS